MSFIIDMKLAGEYSQKRTFVVHEILDALFNHKAVIEMHASRIAESPNNIQGKTKMYQI